jgi:hypothetical protein
MFLDPNSYESVFPGPDRDGETGPDQGRPKLFPRKGEKGRNFMFEEFSFGLELLLEPECPLLGHKKTYMTVFDKIKKIKNFHNLVLDLDPDSETAWIWIRI